MLGYLIYVILGYLMYDSYYSNFTSRGVTEHFIDDSKYNNRLNVMKIFDAILNRKPTLEEIETFSGIDNEQNMLNNIVNKYKTQGEEAQEEPSLNIVKEQPVEVKPITSEFKTFSMDDVNIMVKKIDDMISTATEFKRQLLV